MADSSNLALTGRAVPVPGPAQMQAARLEQPQTITVTEQQIPQPGPGEVRVRLEGCGVCASSLPLWEGRPWFHYPIEPGTPGHEGWGYVDAVGAEVRDLPVGQRVAVLSQHAFAQYDIAPAQSVVPLPAELDHQPFPGEAIGCAMNIFRRSDISEGQTVAIVGAGFLGLLLTQLAVSQGATVIVLSRRQSVLDQALTNGAHAVFSTEDFWGAVNAVKALTDQRGCERVIEVIGLQQGLDLASELVAEYGKLIIGGYHQDGLRQVNMQQWNWRAIDVINAHERDPSRYILGIKEGIAAVLANRLRPQELLTHRFELDELDRAFHMMLERPEGFIKGWVAL